MKKINNDKRRRDTVVGKLVVHLCLTCTTGDAPTVQSSSDTSPTYTSHFSVVEGTIIIIQCCGSGRHD